jgi:arylsulfatase
MEVYAGFAEQTDYEIGRLVSSIQELGKLDNTLFILIAGDNGASAEGQMNGMYSEMTFFSGIPETVPDMLKHYDEWGSPSTYPHFSAGWAVAMDAPFAYTKQVASDFGGTRNAMIVHWPEQIKAKGEVRSQFGHVIDIAPTVYELAKIPAPAMVNGIAQDPVEGTSLAYTFTDNSAAERHTTQYFEMFGNRGIYQDGWFARTIHRAAWEFKPRQPLLDDKWELFNTNEDFSLASDLASQNPDKLKAMQDLFMAEAERYHVLPVDDRLMERTNAALVGRPTVMGERTSLTLGEGMKGMGVDIFIDLRNTSYTITADLEVNASGNGVIVCQGGRFGGLVLYMKNGRPAFTYNYLGLESTTIMSSQTLKPGKYQVVYNFVYDGGGAGKGGTGTITVNGNKTAESRIEKTQPGIFSVDDLADVGVDDGTWVADYGASAEFNGKIDKVTLEQKK